MRLKWCYKCNKETLHNGNNCIICNPNSKCGNQNKILKINNVLYYYDKSIKDYLPWEEYKLKFTTLSNNIELPKDFSIVSTFRIQDSENWEGAKQVFEQTLLDLNVGWFIYVKFYINKENKSIPLVCGKSGSLLVNNRGSDVSFSIDINDGPARRFLAENNFKWDKTRIAILKCNSENEAYKKEEFYLKELNLFGS